MDIAIMTGVFTLLGVGIGGLISYLHEQHKSKKELKMRSFVNLVVVKLPLTQALQTHFEAKLLCEYYEARAYMLENEKDLEEAKLQNNRMLNLIPEVTAQRSNLAKALAEIKIAFDIQKDINELLMSVYKAKSFEIRSVVNLFKTEQELQSWKEDVHKQILSLIKINYTDKIEHLIEYLFPQFERL